MVTTASAQEAAIEPTLDIGGEIFAHYGVDLTEGADLANEFDVARVYFNAKAKLSDTIDARITTDIGRPKEQSIEVDDGAGGLVEVDVPEDSKIRVFLKYAYMGWQTPIDGVKLRFGAAGTPWPGFYDKFWGYRYVSKSFADQFKIQPTSDIGVHALGKHADGLASWQLSLVNGEGYSSPEVDAGKTASFRLSVDPLSSNEGVALPISGFISYDVPIAEAPSGLVWGAATGLKHDNLVLWGETMGTSAEDINGFGWSATVMPRVPDVLDVFGRADSWDPSTDTDGDATLRILGGVGRGFNDYLRAALHVETVSFESSDVSELAAFLRMHGKY